MEHINETDKNRLLQFINENELDYTAQIYKIIIIKFKLY